LFSPTQKNSASETFQWESPGSIFSETIGCHNTSYPKMIIFNFPNLRPPVDHSSGKCDACRSRPRRSPRQRNTAWCKHSSHSRVHGDHRSWPVGWQNKQALKQTARLACKMKLNHGQCRQIKVAFKISSDICDQVKNWLVDNIIYLLVTPYTIWKTLSTSCWSLCLEGDTSPQKAAIVSPAIKWV